MGIRQSRNPETIVSEMKVLNDAIVEDLNPPKFFKHQITTNGHSTVKFTCNFDQVEYQYVLQMKMDQGTLLTVKPAQCFFEGGPMTEEIILPHDRLGQDIKGFISFVLQKYIEFLQRKFHANYIADITASISID